MTWAHRSGHGNTQNKVGATTVVHTVTTASVLVGDVAVVSVAFDNLTTTDGLTSNITGVADSVGNTWTKLYEQTNGNGTAATGASAALWCTKVKTQVPITTGTITATFSASVTSKVMACTSYSLAAGNTFGLVAAVGAVQDASTNGPSCVLPTIVSQPVILLNVDAFETTQTGATLTQDADYNTRINNGTTGSTADTNMKIVTADRIGTFTTDTHLASLALTSDSAGILAAVAEVPDRFATYPPPGRRSFVPQIRAGVW